MVTRGFSAMRVIFISKPKVTLLGSTMPLIGAAERKCGVAATGRWPSAAQQAGGRVEPDPAGAGKIDFGPGVQVGEVLRGAGRTFQRLHVGLELNEIAGHEAGGQTDMAQDLHQQPSRVAAGAGAGAECLLGRLHAGLQAHDVAHQAVQTLIELDQKVGRVARLARNRLDELGQQRPRRLRRDIGRQVFAQIGGESRTAISPRRAR